MRERDWMIQHQTSTSLGSNYPSNYICYLFRIKCDPTLNILLNPGPSIQPLQLGDAIQWALILTLLKQWKGVKNGLTANKLTLFIKEIWQMAIVAPSEEKRHGGYWKSRSDHVVELMASFRYCCFRYILNHTLESIHWLLCNSIALMLVRATSRVV